MDKCQANVQKSTRFETLDVQYVAKINEQNYKAINLNDIKIHQKVLGC